MPTENVTICDQVAFMAKGGYLTYFGPPQEAPQHFGVEKFNQIYRKVEHELSPEQWQQRYLSSDCLSNLHCPPTSCNAGARCSNVRITPPKNHYQGLKLDEFLAGSNF